MNDFELLLKEKRFTENDLNKIMNNPLDLVYDFDRQYRVSVKKSKIHGIGIFTEKDFYPGQTVCSMRVGINRTTGGRYINHSNMPNVIPVMLSNGNIIAVACCQIARGTEVLVNYRETSKFSGVRK